jgi:hypothetical protein
VVYTVTSGPATISGSTVSYTGAGTVVIAANQAGSSTYSAAPTVSATVTVQDFGVAATGGTPSVPVVPGAAASFNLALTPGTAGFSSVITFTATGLPVGATYSFSPGMVTPGSSVASTVFSVQTTKPVATARNLGDAAGITFALLTLPFGVSRKRREALKRTRLLSALGVLLLLGGMAGLNGCGTSSGFFGQPAQRYTITVTGSSGTLTHSTTVILNVQ